ncbi:hypothetical protein ACFSYD_12730 [Paracoccus aerius]
MRNKRRDIHFGWIESIDDIPPGIEQLHALLDVVPPLSRMRMLAENTDNLDLDVVWHYGPGISDLSVAEEHIRLGPPRSHKILVVTEGKTDAEIIEAAMKKLRPDVADFFRFFSTSEWPFGGAGDIPKLLRGLQQLGAELRVIGIFDNDIEGWRSFRSLTLRSIGPYCRAMTLPDLNVFKSFPTVGPGGLEQQLDINGIGAPIEAYLDLTRSHRNGPSVLRWGSWDKSEKKYNGIVDPKDPPRIDFLAWCEGRKLGPYDTSKITAVLDKLIGEAIAMAPCVGHKNLQWNLGAYK